MASQNEHLPGGLLLLHVSWPFRPIKPICALLLRCVLPPSLPACWSPGVNSGPESIGGYPFDQSVDRVTSPICSEWEAEAEHFRKHGFAVIRGLLSREEVDLLQTVRSSWKSPVKPECGIWWVDGMKKQKDSVATDCRLTSAPTPSTCQQISMMSGVQPPARDRHGERERKPRMDGPRAWMYPPACPSSTFGPSGRQIVTQDKHGRAGLASAVGNLRVVLLHSRISCISWGCSRVSVRSLSVEPIQDFARLRGKWPCEAGACGLLLGRRLSRLGAAMLGAPAWLYNDQVLGWTTGQLRQRGCGRELTRDDSGALQYIVKPAGSKLAVFEWHRDSDWCCSESFEYHPYVSVSSTCRSSLDTTSPAIQMLQKCLYWFIP